MSLLEPAVEAPDYAAPVEAWRVWRVVDVDGEVSLGSAVQATIWPAGDALVARCLRRQRMLSRLRRRPEHDAPQTCCQCGIYAGEPSVLRQYLAEPLGSTTVARVFGRVALWGVVVECERGFRASHAYPLEIYVPSDAGRPRDVHRIAEGLARYDAPIELLDERGRDALLLLARARSV